MYIDIVDRTVSLANYIVDKQTTIRACANHFNIPKSTVHFDLKYRLPKINKALYLQVKTILTTNFDEKHIRGGESTKQKYLQEKSLNI